MALRSSVTRRKGYNEGSQAQRLSAYYHRRVATLAELPLTARLFLKAYPWRRIDPVPWSPLRRPLQDARVALVTTAGLSLPAQEPFDNEVRGGDWTFREIRPMPIRRRSSTRIGASRTPQRRACRREPRLPHRPHPRAGARAGHRLGQSSALPVHGIDHGTGTAHRPQRARRRRRAGGRWRRCRAPRPHMTDVQSDRVSDRRRDRAPRHRHRVHRPSARSRGESPPSARSGRPLPARLPARRAQRSRKQREIMLAALRLLEHEARRP